MILSTAAFQKMSRRRLKSSWGRRKDELFDKIIPQEDKMFSTLSYKGEIESNPTYFKDMKKMYQKEWKGIRNPIMFFCLLL